MLDYDECKKVFSDKLQNDLLGKGRIEAAFFAAVKFAYQRGFDDASALEQVNHDNQSR